MNRLVFQYAATLYVKDLKRKTKRSLQLAVIIPNQNGLRRKGTLCDEKSAVSVMASCNSPIVCDPRNLGPQG